MLAKERRDKIKKRLLEENTVTVTDMKTYFNVSDQTIRRDFKELEKQGVLIRAHGGALVNEDIVSNIDINLRKKMIQSEKVKIAKKSVEFIQSGDSIFLDNSSTSLTIAKYLPNIDIKIITNSLLVSKYVANFENITLITIGGTLDKVNMCYVGNAALNMMSDYFIDKVFISSSSINMGSGIVDSNEEVATIRKKAISNSFENYLIVDHTKFDKTSLFKVSDFDQIKVVITDKNPGEKWVKFLEENKIKLCFPS